MHERGRMRFVGGLRTGSAWRLVALSALAAQLVTGCASESREELLRAFALELPACPTEVTSFSGTTSWPDTKLAMSLTVSKDCAEQYLKDHGVDMAKPIHWPASGPSIQGSVTLSPTDPPFQDKAMKQFDLTLDPSKRYDMFRGFTTPKEAEFLVLLVPEGARTAVYMESGATGKVKRNG